MEKNGSFGSDSQILRCVVGRQIRGERRPRRPECRRARRTAARHRFVDNLARWRCVLEAAPLGQKDFNACPEGRPPENRSADQHDQSANPACTIEPSPAIPCRCRRIIDFVSDRWSRHASLQFNNVAWASRPCSLETHGRDARATLSAAQFYSADVLPPTHAEQRAVAHRKNLSLGRCRPVIHRLRR